MSNNKKFEQIRTHNTQVCQPSSVSSERKKTYLKVRKILKAILNIISIVLFFGGIAGMCWLDVTGNTKILCFTSEQMICGIFSGLIMFLTVECLSSIYYD